MKNNFKHITVNKLLIVLALIIIAAGSRQKAYAAIQSVIVTPAAPTLVKGNPYYLAGVQYEFRVQVIDPVVTAITDYTTVTLDIPLDTITVTATWTGATDGFTLSANAQNSVITASTRSGLQNLDLRFRITFAYNINGATGISVAPATPITITATADSVSTPGNVTSTVDSIYGFCNQIKILNIAQDGDAADGKINPHYDSGNFTITGTVIYNIAGADATDTVNGTVGTITLYEDADNVLATTGDNTATAYTDGTADTDVSISVLYTYFNNRALRNYYWRCSVAMTGLGGATYSQNTLALNNDRVRVTAMAVSLGGGRDNGNYHWRSTLVTGTRFTITAQMQNGGGGMDGNTTFYINYSGAPDNTTEFSAAIPNGQNTASIIIPQANTPVVTEGTTTGHQYYVVRIEGSSYGSQGDPGYPEARDDEVDDHVSLSYGGAAYTSQYVHWENADPPDITTANINPAGFLASATQATFVWTSTLDTSNTSADGDFYEYRIYVRESAMSGTFYQWDGDNDPLLRSLTPANTTTVQNLKIFTEYEYYLVAVDVFGNESAVMNESGASVPPNAFSTFTTTPYSIGITISDGVTRYTNDQFITAGVPTTPGDYASRELRVTNLRIDINIVSSEAQPDSVTVWYTNEVATDINIAAGSSPNTGAFTAPNYLESAAARKSAPNTYTAYLPTTSPVIAQGNAVRFIIETERAGVRVFSDIDSSTDVDPNDAEWAVYLNTPTTFTPWPTRILNNVITKKNPRAYPAYYLTDDAKVTIKVYDVKGRPVATLLENAYRKGGQNIKEQGWAGINKYRKKLGPGLYYIHIQAKRASDNRQLLNDFKKVVIAR